MTPPFRTRSAYAKIERAKQHIADLERAIKAFHDTNPYTISREDHPEGLGGQLWRVHISRYPPPELAPIIGDAVHNLRSALDHLMVALVEANNRKPSNATEFPIFASAETYEAKAGGKVEGARHKASEMIAALKPYKGGNDGFWQIQKLDVIDKHRALVTVAASNTKVTVDFTRSLQVIAPPEWGEIPALPIDLRPKRRCPLKDGDVLFAVRQGPVHDNPKFTFDVALNEPGVSECEPIHPTLVQLADLVEGTIAPFWPLLR